MVELSTWRALHVLGAVLLVGNVTVTGFWAAFLYAQRASLPFRPVARAILWTDLLFTAGGAALLTFSGIQLMFLGIIGALASILASILVPSPKEPEADPAVAGMETELAGIKQELSAIRELLSGDRPRTTG